MSKITLKNIAAFNIGWIRYHLYYSKYKWINRLIRKHIKEQIDLRIKSMNRKCYESGSCIKCGCATTALQMANKVCDGDCYPVMQTKDKWKMFKEYGYLSSKGFKKGDIVWEVVDDKFKKVK